jgi:hypothetical protein
MRKLVVVKILFFRKGRMGNTKLMSEQALHPQAFRFSSMLFKMEIDYPQPEIEGIFK